MLAARLKHAIKVALAHTLYYTGILYLWQAVVLRRKAVVLMYHRVLTADERRRTGSHPGIIVDRDTFAMQMAVVKRRFRTLSVDEFADRLGRRAAFESSSCLITFDDGWQDNLTHALPVLRHHQLPAVIFLPVNFIGTQRLFWREALTHLLVQAVQRVESDAHLQARLNDLLRPHGLQTIVDRRDPELRPAVIEAIAAQPHLRAPQAEALMATVSAELVLTVDTAATPDCFVSWDQVRHMSSLGVAFGGHGAEHRQLAECSLLEAAAEIDDSKIAVDRHAAAGVPTFSYPNGSVSAGVMQAVKAAGFRLAFTTAAGPVNGDDEPLMLKRVNIHEDMTDTPPMFLARVVGLF